MKTLILCLGNSILGDDGVGLAVARRLRKTFSDPHVHIVEAGIGGIRLLDYLAGYDKAIIIDAIQTKKAKPGHIFKFTRDSLEETSHTNSTHDCGLLTALKLGTTLKMAIPLTITMYAIEVEEVDTFTENCSPAVNKASISCTELILRELGMKP